MEPCYGCTNEPMQYDIGCVGASLPSYGEALETFRDGFVTAKLFDQTLFDAPVKQTARRLGITDKTVSRWSENSPYIRSVVMKDYFKGNPDNPTDFDIYHQTISARDGLSEYMLNPKLPNYPEIRDKLTELQPGDLDDLLVDNFARTLDSNDRILTLSVHYAEKGLDYKSAKAEFDKAYWTTQIIYTQPSEFKEQTGLSYESAVKRVKELGLDIDTVRQYRDEHRTGSEVDMDEVFARSRNSEQDLEQVVIPADELRKRRQGRSNINPQQNKPIKEDSEVPKIISLADWKEMNQENEDTKEDIRLASGF